MAGDAAVAPNVKQAVPFFNVTDIEASLRFYVDGLGFVMTNRWVPEGRVRWCWLQLGDAAIMLQEYWRDGRRSGAPEGPLGQGVSICLICEDALTIYHDLVARGIGATRPFVGNSLWVTSVTDPDGYRLEFESPTEVAEKTVYADRPGTSSSSAPYGLGDVQFREAHLADAEAISLAHIDSIRSIGPTFYPPEVVEVWGAGLTPDVYLNAMKRGEAFFVAIGTLDNELVVLGFATHRVDDAQDGVSVYVRGRAARQGLGTALLQRAEGHALAHGASSIQIQASLAGVEFYKANGFEEVGQGGALLLSGQSMPCVFMRKFIR